tara:strand:- start:6106 stop:7044 length:939 start_codon:yes stop_codon:yes gene_type:complete
MRKSLAKANLYNMDIALPELKALIAKQFGLTPKHIFVGVGSTEILNAAAFIYGKNGGEILTSDPTFESIHVYGKTIGASLKKVPLRDDFEMDIPALRRAMSRKTKLIYVCNPNNPTGNITPDRKLRSFCEEATKKALAFVDEAYHEYVRDRRYKSLIDMVKAGKNVLVSRTASKIHGLAGMRIGFGIAKPEIVSELEPYMTAMSLNNIVGLRAALASYQDTDHQVFCLRKNNEARKVVTDLLDEMGRQYAPSETNFIFFHTGKPIEQFQAEMQKRGVRVGRPFPPYLDWCRLSLVKPEQMSLFVRAFREVMA